MAGPVHQTVAILPKVLPYVVSLLPFLPKVVCLQSSLLYLLSSFFLLPHCVSSSGRRYVAPRRLRWRGEAVIATITAARTKLFDIQYVPHQYILINRH